MAEDVSVVHTRSKSAPVTQSEEKRKIRLGLETRFYNAETKLVVLDFLSTAPSDHLTARNKRSKSDSRSKSLNVQARRSSLSKSSSDVSHLESYRRRYVKLADSGRSLRKQYSVKLQKEIDEYLNSREKSVDDHSGVNETEEKKNLNQPSKPKRKISQELKNGIKDFDLSTLRHVEIQALKVKAKSQLNDDVQKKQNRPNNLDLTMIEERKLSTVLSPESQVAAKLELISKEIVDQYPDFFKETMSMVSLQDLTYEKFASVARKVIEKHPGGWTKIALVCYFARELALDDESPDDQLENLVNLSSRFILETSADWIANQGGWVALEDSQEVLSIEEVRQKLKEDSDVTDGPTYGQTMLKWQNLFKYGVAALAVGVTVAYSVVKFD